MMARAQTPDIGPNIAGRVALGEQIATRLWWATACWKADLLSCFEVVNDTACRSERLWRLGTNAARHTLYLFRSLQASRDELTTRFNN